jgi:hypothetical protein
MLPPSVLQANSIQSGYNFTKWFDFDAFEHTLRDVRIGLHKGFRRGLALKVGNYQAATAVSEGTAHDHSAAVDQRPQVFEMRRSHSRPQRRSVVTIVTNNYEEHRAFSLAVGCRSR